MRPVTSRVLVALSVICSAAYLLGQTWHPFPGSVVLKGLAIFPLALLAWIFLRKRSHIPVKSQKIANDEILL